MQLKRVVSLGRRNIHLIEFDRRACERAPGIPALALQSLARAVGRENHVTVIVGIKVSLNVRLLLGVCRANRIGTALGGFERVRNNKRDVLTVIPNHIILKRRTPLLANASEPSFREGAEDWSDVLSMKNRAHTGHLFRRGGVELEQSAVGNRCLNGYGVQHPGKVKIRGVLCQPAHFARPIHARRVTTNRRSDGCFWCCLHVLSL